MIIKKESQNKKLSNNILSLAQIASEAKRNKPESINATIGMFNHNNSFYTFKSVKEVMGQIDDYSAFAYSDTDGGKLFEKAILRWVFRDYLDTMLENNFVSVVATPGGSGAISTTFQNYLDCGDTVLLPIHMWETYITFIKERNCCYETYNLTNDKDEFDIDSLREKIIQIKDKQDRIVLVINDPCHNPTGFCMSDNDYDRLINLINEFKDYQFVLLMDVAYFDFYNSNGNIIRKRFSKLGSLGKNVLINFAFSGSKTFGLYGLRIGASIMFGKDKQEIECFKNAITYTARSNWSSVSSLGISIINKLVLDEKYEQMFIDEVKSVCSELEKRSAAFIEEAKKIGLPILPFTTGFFVCVLHKDPVRLMNKLHEYDTYVVVTKSCIRVALCAINEDEARRLPQIIANAINNLEE